VCALLVNGMTDLGSKVCRSEGFHLGLYQGTSYNGLNTLLAFSGTESERIAHLLCTR
jgi:hypothetical protein